MPIVPWGQIVQEYKAEDHCITQRAGAWHNNTGSAGGAIGDVQRPFLQSEQQPTVDCQEFQQLITPAVDQRLKPPQWHAFVDHAAICSTCRHDYELELGVKTLVQSRVKMVKTPGTLLASIARQIHRIDRDPLPVLPVFTWEAFLGRPLVKPGLVLAVVCALLIVVLVSNRSTGIAPLQADSNVLLQSFSNFHEFLAGVLQPQVVSNHPDQVRNFLEGKTNFSVHVPVMSKCTLIGGMANEYHGIKLAHVVYRHGTYLIYMFQAPYDRVMEGGALALPEAAKQELLNTGWFSDAGMDGDTIVLWARGNTLCAAVSRMDRNALIACLSLGDSSTRMH